MVNPKLRDELNDQLCHAVLELSNVEECYQFFEDICTIGELKAMSQRLEVARMLMILWSARMRAPRRSAA